VLADLRLLEDELCTGVAAHVRRASRFCRRRRWFLGHPCVDEVQWDRDDQQPDAEGEGDQVQQYKNDVAQRGYPSGLNPVCAAVRAIDMRSPAATAAAVSRL
jgi:hypothetical protein